MPRFISVFLCVVAIVASGESRAAYVPLGAIAGADSPFPGAPVPGGADISFAPGHTALGSLVGNLTNGCGIYDGGGGIISKTGTACPVTPDLRKAIDYDNAPDRIVLDSAMFLGLGLLVKEGHPERPAGTKGRDQKQVEDFDILLFDANGNAGDPAISMWHYTNQGSTISTDDAYYSGFFTEMQLAAGSYFLSFRIPGYPTPGPGDPRGGSVEFLAQLSARASVPEPTTLWMLGLGLVALASGRRSIPQTQVTLLSG